MILPGRFFVPNKSVKFRKQPLKTGKSRDKIGIRKKSGRNAAF